MLKFCEISTNSAICLSDIGLTSSESVHYNSLGIGATAMHEAIDLGTSLSRILVSSIHTYVLPYYHTTIIIEAMERTPEPFAITPRKKAS